MHVMTDLSAFQGKRGYYYLTSVGSSYHGASRIVCLNCTAYFRTKCNKTQLKSNEHKGSMRVRFCPCCGAELTTQITPNNIDYMQQRLEI